MDCLYMCVTSKHRDEKICPDRHRIQYILIVYCIFWKNRKIKKKPESGEIRTENSWSCSLTVFRLHLAQRGHNPREISSKQGLG